MKRCKSFRLYSSWDRAKMTLNFLCRSVSKEHFTYSRLQEQGYSICLMRCLCCSLSLLQCFWWCYFQFCDIHTIWAKNRQDWFVIFSIVFLLIPGRGFGFNKSFVSWLKWKNLPQGTPNTAQACVAFEPIVMQNTTDMRWRYTSLITL